MSDESTTDAPTTDAPTGGKPDYTPPATQADLDKIIADRISRERGKFADYDDLKKKAGEYDKTVEASKTELQKAIDRAEAAEKAIAAKDGENARLAAIAKHSIPADYADLVRGSTPDELEASAEKVKSLLAAAPGRLVIPAEGKQPATPSGSGDFIRDAFKKGA